MPTWLKDTIKDRRLELADSYDYSFNNLHRTPVDTLIAKYAPVIDRFNEEHSKQEIILIRRKGDRYIRKRLVLTFNLKHRLNKAIPKLKEFSKQYGNFTIPQFCDLLDIKKTAAWKYVDLLLAYNLLKSDGKVWDERFQWNFETEWQLL